MKKQALEILWDIINDGKQPDIAYKELCVLFNARLSLPSEEDIFNDAVMYGKRLFDMDMNQEQLDLIQGSMRFMRDIIVDQNNCENE